VRRRVWAVRRRGLGEALRPRRASRHAFLPIPPACLIAHLGSFLTLGTRLRLDSGIKVGLLLTLQVRHTAQSQLSLPTAGQSISREAKTDFMSTTITWHRRHHIPSLRRNKAGREPSHVCVHWHTGHLVIDHQLQTVPAPIAAIMNGASPCPMLAISGDEQKESVPAHRSSH